MKQLFKQFTLSIYMLMGGVLYASAQDPTDIYEWKGDIDGQEVTWQIQLKTVDETTFAVIHKAPVLENQTIPTEVTINDITYPVMELGADCFAENTNIRSIKAGQYLSLQRDEQGNESNPFGNLNIRAINMEIPAELADQYKASELWSQLNYPANEDDFVCDYTTWDNVPVTWKFKYSNDRKTATLYGTNVTDYEELHLPDWIREYNEELDSFEPTAEITSIAPHAFENYASVQKVFFPTNISFIGDAAFKGDDNIKMLKMESDNAPESDGKPFGAYTIGYAYFSIPYAGLESYTSSSAWGDLSYHIEVQGAEYTESGVTWTFDTNSLEDAMENGFVATIYASTDCPESVFVPQNMYIGGTPYASKRIEYRDGHSIFGENTKEVNLEDVEELVGADWTEFLNNPQIESVTALKLKNVNDALFFDTNLKSLNLSEACKEIGFRALSNCPVETVSGTVGLEYVGENAFDNSGIRSINLTGCTKIAADAFNECSNLESIYLDEVIRDFDLDEKGSIRSPFGNTNTAAVTLHYPADADGDLYKTAEIWGWFHYLDADGNGQTYKYKAENGEIWGFSINADKTSASIYGTGITRIDDFIGQDGHGAGELVIPNEVKLGEQAYAVTALGNSAFSSFDGLQRIVLPSTITSIAPNAFYHCDALHHIFIENEESMVTVPEGLFEGHSVPNIYLVAPSAVVAQYVADAEWSKLKIVTGGIFDYTDEDGVTWTVETMAPAKWYNYYGHECDDMSDKVQILDAKGFGTKVNVPNTVTIANREYYVYKINGDNSAAPDKVEGREAFPFNQDITEVVLPPSVKELGWGAFRECHNLEKINLENVEMLHDWCFGNTKLTEVDITSAKGVGAGTFNVGIENVSYLKKAILSSACEEIGDAAFSGCTELEDLGDVSGVKAIGRNAFENTTSLQTLNFSNTLKQVGEKAFMNSGVTTVGSTSGVVCMGWGAFSHSKIQKVDLSNCALLDEWVFDSCNDLEEVGSVAHLQSLGHGVFWDCTSLKKLDLSNKCGYIGHRAVAGCTSLTELGDLSGCTYIESFAFDNDQSLKEINLPNASYIGEKAFLNCTAVVNYVNGTTFYPEYNEDYSLYVDDVDVTEGKLIIPLKLRLKEGSSICAFQSDILLPKGCTASSFGIDLARIDVEKATAMSSFSNGENGRCRTMGMSFPCEPFIGNDGTIGTLVIALNGASEGNYTSPSVTNVVLATTEGTAIYVGSCGFTFNISEGEGGAAGDINGDGQSNTADVVNLANYVLNNAGESAYDTKYDVNHDGKISMADVAYLINMFMQAK